MADEEQVVFLEVPPIFGASIESFEGSRRAKHIDPSLIGAHWLGFLSLIHFSRDKSGHDSRFIPGIHAPLLITGGKLLFLTFLLLVLLWVIGDLDAVLELAFSNAAAVVATD